MCVPILTFAARFQERLQGLAADRGAEAVGVDLVRFVLVVPFALLALFRLLPRFPLVLLLLLVAHLL